MTSRRWREEGNSQITIGPQGISKQFNIKGDVQDAKREAEGVEKRQKEVQF